MKSNRHNSWNLDDEKTVSYKLDATHTLYIKRIGRGFQLKVKEKFENKKTVVLYYNNICDSQLGHLKV